MTRRAVQLQRISRRGLISSAVLAGVLSATGVQVQARQRGGVLRLGLSGTADTLDPRDARGMFFRVAGPGAIYETLTEITATGELTGELAESWEPSAEALVWTVNLRQGIPFHDGRMVTAADVAASFAALAGSPARAILDRISRTHVPNDHQIRFELRAADANFPLLLADPHLVVAPGGVFDGTGSGLYRVAEFVPGERLRLLRVDGHWRDGRAGWFDAVVLRAIAEPAARTAALLAGHADAVDTPATGDLIETRRGFHVLRSETHGLSFSAATLSEARAAGLALTPGAAPGEIHSVHPAYAEVYADGRLCAGRYGPWVETVMPVLPPGDSPPVAHMPLTIAHNDRLRHDAVGDLFPMDSGRIAQRWWFA